MRADLHREIDDLLDLVDVESMDDAVHDHRKLVRLDLRRQPPLQINRSAQHAATTAVLGKEPPALSAGGWWDQRLAT